MSQALAKSYRVGDMVQYNNAKSFGYVIQVQSDLVKVVNDQGCMQRIQLVEIDKLVSIDPKAYTRDCHGNVV